MSRRVQALLEPYFSLHENWFSGVRQVQKIVKQVANRAKIIQNVTPHVLRHTFATPCSPKKVFHLPQSKKHWVMIGYQQQLYI